MEKTLTIRTADRSLAEQLHEEIGARTSEHINMTWFEGAWQLELDDDSREIEAIADELRSSENYAEGKFIMTVE